MGKAKLKTPLGKSAADATQEPAEQASMQEPNAASASTSYEAEIEAIKRAVNAKYRPPSTTYEKLARRLNVLSLQYHHAIGNTMLYKLEVWLWNGSLLFLLGLVLFATYKQSIKLYMLVLQFLSKQ